MCSIRILSRCCWGAYVHPALRTFWLSLFDKNGETFVGLAYATLIDRSRFESPAKSLLFALVAISFVGAGIWKFVYAQRPQTSDQIGLTNQLRIWVGLEPMNFLNNAPLNTFFLILVMVWIQTGFAMVVLSAAIKGIPTDQVEAAKLDGANAWQMFRHVTVPAIRPALVVVVVLLSLQRYFVRGLLAGSVKGLTLGLPPLSLPPVTFAGMDSSAAPTLATTPAELRAAADAVLHALTGRTDVTFREGQWEAVEALVARGERALVVQRTGWGKSAVYFVATALRRRAGAGPTLLVSPLLALMRDQIAAAERAGVRAAQVSSANATEWGEVTAQVQRGEVDVLLISPERLTNPRFRDEVLPGLVQACGLLVVDEAHCISDWGHDFRPDYRRIRELLGELPPGTPVLATTATANSRVVQDVAAQLTAGPGGRPVPVTTVRGPLARESLRLGVLALPDAASRLAWLDAHLGSLPGSGIVYALTVSAAEQAADLLRRSGHQVLAYTGRTDDAERREAEQLLRANEVKALVATSALGMGFDKPDLGFVVHLGSPSSPVSYYQQVGRAGRAVERADVLLLPGPEDAAIWHWFATSSMPRELDADAVLDTLAAARGPLSVAVLETAANVRRSKLELLLKVLAVDGAVRREGSGWVGTGQPWTYDADRYQRVAAAREDEQASMLGYQRLQAPDCRMSFLQRSLDDPTASPCGRCDLCAGTWFPTEVPAGARGLADEVLHRPGVVMEPRRLWPTGMDRLGVAAKGKIPPAEQLEPGRAVARLTDLGWGGTLRDLLAVSTPDGPVPEALVKACVQVLAEWGWQTRPAGVVSIASRRRPLLVASLAERISEIGRLPLLGSVQPVGPGPQGDPGGNSAYRLAGVWDSLAVGSELTSALARLGGAPVLLVDDLADSRWTMTVAGRALRQAGSGPVLPLTLAVAG